MTPPDPAEAGAFAELVREHQASLRAFIRSLGVEADWVDDLAQEAFIIAFQKRAVFEPGKDFGRWLRGIARHLVANERRKKARHARLLDGALTEALIENAPEDEADTVDAGSLARALEECVGRLPERSRGLLRRRYEENENASALSAHFGMTAEAIRQALLRLRVTVKQCVERTLGEVWR
jgi:RNA polymerase sigma-70 factor (ECF subfamily)